MSEKETKPKAAAVPAAADDHEPHPDYPELTRGQVRDAQAKAKRKAEKARIDAAMRRAEEDEARRLFAEELNSPESVIGAEIPGGGSLNEIVEIILDMPPVAYGKNDRDAWIQIDGKRRMRGQKITCRRHIANDLLFIADRMKQNEAARLGEDKFSYYQKAQAPRIDRVGGGIRVVAGAGEKLGDVA